MDHRRHGAKPPNPLMVVLRGIGQGLWMLIPVLGLGLLPWVPAAQAYWKSRSAGWLVVTALLAVAAVTAVVGFTVEFDDNSLLGAAYIGGALGGVAAAVPARRVVFGRERHEIDPAIATVLDSRERREQARAILAEDPEMARELRIGRPDIGRRFDDGGLIDVNNAGPGSIAQALGCHIDVARVFVAERDARDGFASVAEIGALSSVGPDFVERYQERMIVLPYEGRELS